jgi:hypothetical protein
VLFRSADFDPGPETDIHTATGNNDYEDAFLSKFLPDGGW